MIYERKRYWEVRTISKYTILSNESNNCQLDEIKSEHRKSYDTLSEAKRDRGYDKLSLVPGRFDPVKPRRGKFLGG